ncbi:MAG TPA: PAS domain S-box protein [Mucilaginibacter sp.]
MYKPKRNIIVVTTAVISIVTGCIVMVGWLFNLPRLQTIVPGFVAMKFNPALCFVFFGAALLFTQSGNQRLFRPAFFVLSGFGTVIAILTIIQDIFNFNSGIDQLFIHDATDISLKLPFPGRMAFTSSVNFILLGAGFLTVYKTNRTLCILSQTFFQTVTILSGIALIGYLYGSAVFFTLFHITSMAVHTAILFFILSIAASFLNSSIGVMRLFTGTQVGNQMARRLYALMILIVIFVGIFRLTIQGHKFNVVPLETGISLMAIGALIICLLLVWNTANWLNKIDKQRSEAEEEVKKMNARLERMVAERSAEYQKSEEKYHSLIEQASDTIYILNLDGNFTDVNASMCRMMGYSREELLKLNIGDIVDPDELAYDPLPKRMDNTNKPVVRERRFKRKDGKIFTVEVNVKRFADDRIMVIARDVTDRKKMEAELREAEVKFRTLVEKSMVGVYIIQYGKYVYVNPRFAEIFGYTPDELIGSVAVETVIDKSHRDIVTENIRKRIDGEVETVNYETMGLKKDGTNNWVELHGSRTEMAGIPTIIGSMIDVTKRKKAEEELRSSEQKYKLLFDSNPMPMWMISKDDQMIIAANDAAARHYGYTKDELLKLNAKSLRPPEDFERQQEGYRRQINNENYPDIVRHLKKDGTLMYVQIIAHDIIFEGRSVRLSLTNDITERLKAEESLKKSEANLATILNTTDTAYALFDLDLKMLAFNQKAISFVKEQYNHDPENGDSLSDYFPPDRFPQVADYARDVLHGSNINYEIDYKQPDGTVMWYYVRLFPITNDNKEILGMMMALYDITERKKAEHDLKSAYERIHMHINSIRNMAWKQSHLIRSPLANLQGLVAMLKDECPDEILYSHIQTELNRMDAIIIEMAKDASDHD